jgi:hypothetical protein
MLLARGGGGHSLYKGIRGGSARKGLIFCESRSGKGSIFLYILGKGMFFVKMVWERVCFFVKVVSERVFFVKVVRERVHFS